jgi:hypothetical protein
MQVVSAGKVDGRHLEIPVKVTFRDRRDPALRHEEEHIIPVYISHEDLEQMRQEERAGYRSFHESLRWDLQVLVEDMLRDKLMRFPNGYLQVTINGKIQGL